MDKIEGKMDQNKGKMDKNQDKMDKNEDIKNGSKSRFLFLIHKTPKIQL